MKPKLFIDTTSNRLVFALIFNDQNIIEIIETDKNMTDLLVKKLNFFLLTNNISKNNISDLYIISGPGNFTGVRIGSIFANTLKIINNVKIFCITSCEFQQTNEKQLSIIDAKSNLFYVFIKNKIEMLPHSKIIELAKLENLEILHNYLNYNFDDCWNFNKNKFEHVEEVMANYVKGVI